MVALPTSAANDSTTDAITVPVRKQLISELLRMNTRTTRSAGITVKDASTIDADLYTVDASLVCTGLPNASRTFCYPKGQSRGTPSCSFGIDTPDNGLTRSPPRGSGNQRPP